MSLIAKTLHGTVVVEDTDGGIWWPAEATTEIIEGNLVLCESPDGWSLHAPGSADEDIATGDAPYLVSGEGQPTKADYRAAREALAVELCQTGAAGVWRS